LRNNIDNLEKESKIYLKKVNDYEEKHQSMMEIVEENIKNREKEVKLRVKFEDKINNMHALNRNTEEQYVRAKEDIGNFESKSI